MDSRQTVRAHVFHFLIKGNGGVISATEEPITRADGKPFLEITISRWYRSSVILYLTLSRANRLLGKVSDGRHVQVGVTITLRNPSFKSDDDDDGRQIDHVQDVKSGPITHP